MKTRGMYLFALAALLFWSNAPAWAQRGQGRGSAGSPAGGPPSISSWPQGGLGQSGTRNGRDANRPEIGQPRNDRSQGSSENRSSGKPETRPDSAQRSPAEHLAQSPKLSSKLQGFFPAGTNLAQQAEGFKNLGDFVSAAHVSRNLNIPFADLKTRMGNGQSLGDAIHALKPDADHRAEERKAREQARKDLQEAGSRP